LQPHLYLAGDYTYADYPASIEGAVRSGLLCASLIASEDLTLFARKSLPFTAEMDSEDNEVILYLL